MNMKIRKSYIFIMFIFLIVFGFGILFYKADHIVPTTLKYSSLGNNTDYFYLGKGVYYKNWVVIQKFYDVNKDKTMKLVPFDDGITTQLLSIYYGSDKGQGLFIDEKGRIFFAVSKTDIRNKSFLHWIWWHLNKTEPFDIMYYRSEPDQKVVELAKQIKAESARQNN